MSEPPTLVHAAHVPDLTLDREALGRLAHALRAGVGASWEALPEGEREIERQVGEQLAQRGARLRAEDMYRRFAADPARLYLTSLVELLVMQARESVSPGDAVVMAQAIHSYALQMGAEDLRIVAAVNDELFRIFITADALAEERGSKA